MKTVTEISIDGEVVEIKSKRDERHASGWSVIAFTPHISIRCVKCHRTDGLSAFADAIVASVIGATPDQSPDDVNRMCRDVEKAIQSIID